MGFQNSTVFLERKAVHIKEKGRNVLWNIRSRNTNELCSILSIERLLRKYRDSGVC